MMKILVTETQLKGIIQETFFQDLDSNHMSLHGQYPKKRETDLSGLNIEDLKLGFNNMYLNDVKVGSFTVKTIGDVLDPHNHKTYKNSIFLRGGFIIDKEYRNMGIGRGVIKKIFENNPNIENIFLYAIEWQRSVDFWKKIGGEDVFVNPENGLHLIKLTKNNIF